VYVDAFAGTGYRTQSKISPDNPLSLFDDEDVQSFQKGSAYIALETEPSFDHFLFIELNPKFASELEGLKEKFPQKADRVTIIREEANSFLQKWCARTDWRNNRAVLFLDPYGMEVEWKTINAIARTKAIDLWLLFPLGQAVNRLLTRKHPPKDAWADRLTRFFGTEEWKDAFYQKRRALPLFSDEETLEKEADFDSISQFFVRRLESTFEKVAKNPLQLCNSRNVPIFLLCFAAANPKGATTAVKIAQHILKR